jgi:choloylglycine hydrolase
VIEYVNGGQMNLYDNPLGVVTNAPEFGWHLTNLRNYVNLSAVEVPAIELAELELAPLGAGSGLRGIPGDNTPPSRFVRAVAYTQTARPTTGGLDTVREVFRILDQFQLAVGAAEGSDHGSGGEELPASTQWTTAADTANLRYFYHTAWNRRLREIDLNAIDFAAAEVVVQRLDGDDRSEDVQDMTPR